MSIAKPRQTAALDGRWSSLGLGLLALLQRA